MSKRTGGIKPLSIVTKLSMVWCCYTAWFNTEHVGHYAYWTMKVHRISRRVTIQLLHFQRWSFGADCAAKWWVNIHKLGRSWTKRLTSFPWWLQGRLIDGWWCFIAGSLVVHDAWYWWLVMVGLLMVNYGTKVHQWWCFMLIWNNKTV